MKNLSCSHKFRIKGMRRTKFHVSISYFKQYSSLLLCNFSTSLFTSSILSLYFYPIFLKKSPIPIIIASIYFIEPFEHYSFSSNRFAQLWFLLINFFLFRMNFPYCMALILNISEIIHVL